jgi:hypothetical protein
VIYVKRHADIIPPELLKKAVAAEKKLEQLPADKRAEHIKKNSKIWKAFKKYLSQMSYGKCWYSESPEAQSHLDVDHFRPKLEARRDEKVCDNPGYEWLAFSWDNFRLSAQLSNRPVRNEETEETDGKGSWFPLVDGSPKACWDSRGVNDERPMLLDPANAADVRLIEVQADGRMGPSKYCHGTNKTRVQESIVRLGLDLPRLKASRLRVMRDVKALSEILGTVLDANSKEATIYAAINAIQAKTHPREPYAAAARSQLRMMGFGDLCIMPEEA